MWLVDEAIDTALKASSTGLLGSAGLTLLGVPVAELVPSLMVVYLVLLIIKQLIGIYKEWKKN